jgi:tetratricopeptide (TPR) repeat protein
MSLKSRLWRRLDEAIAAESMPLQAAILRAQRAVLMARHGREALAREELTALHQRAFQSPDPRLGAWLHFAEGLTGYFSDMGIAATDRVLRAEAAAKSLGLKDLEALCAAWLAYLAFVQHDIRALVDHALAAQALAAPEQHGARGRLALTLGIAHDFADAGKAAQAWYAEARRHASAEGDDASQSALIYNMTAMRVSQLRQQGLNRPARPIPEQLMGADSVAHYDAAVDVAVLPDLTPLLRAQLLVLQGDYAQAQAIYAEHLPHSRARGLARLVSSLLAEVAWCRVNLGQTELALRQAEEAELEFDLATDADDRAVTLSRLAQVYAALGDGERALGFEQRAAAEWTEVRAQQAQWAGALKAAGLTKP